MRKDMCIRCAITGLGRLLQSQPQSPSVEYSIIEGPVTTFRASRICRSVPRSVVVLFGSNAPAGPFGKDARLDLRLRVVVPFFLEVVVAVGNIRVMFGVEVNQNLGKEQT